MQRPIDIIARHRTADCVAVRWAFDTERWPEGDVELVRELDGQRDVIGGFWRLPGAVEPVAGQWDIDPVKLEADWQARGAEVSGPALPSLAEALALRPALVFTLPRVNEATLDRELAGVAALFLDAHRSDDRLDRLYWHGAPPEIDTLLDMANGTPSEQQIYIDVIKYYRREAPIFLLTFAVDFGVARLLGFGWEDRLPHFPAQSLNYAIELRRGGRPERAQCEARPVDRNAPPPSAAPELELAPHARILYPDFGRFFLNAAWRPVLAAGMDPRLVERTADALVARQTVATPTAHVRWVGPSEDLPRERVAAPLLSWLAKTWKIERFSFGAGRVREPNPPPPEGPVDFADCQPGIWRAGADENHFFDGREIPLGDPPFGGWHSYHVLGRDLFGIVGPPSPEATIAMADPEPPPPPLARFDKELVDFPARGATTPVHLDWTEAHELVAPDALRFRIFQQWSLDQYRPVVIEESPPPASGPAPLPDDLDIVEAQIRVTDDGELIAQAELAGLVGGTLLAPGGMEFAVRAAPADSTLLVSRSAGRSPPPCDAMIRTATPRAARPQVVEIDRTPAATAHVELRSDAPLTVVLLARGKVDPETGVAVDMEIPPATGRVYLHLPGLGFKARPTKDASAFELLPPDGASPAWTDMAKAMATLGAGALADWLNGSPALWLPPHIADLPLAPPDGFAAGRVHIEVTSIDTYGHQSDPVLARVPARLSAPPVAVRLPWVPRVWAHDAAEYADTARAAIVWPAMAGAVRYEVERALEAALGLTPQSSDDRMLVEAGKQGAAFERISDSATYPRIQDALPGRAPTRAVFRVRGVSAGGTTGEWSMVALVWVPDVRIPPAPVPLGAKPDPDRERGVLCSWTQPGPVEAIGFQIEARPVRQGKVGEEDWAVVSELVPGAVTPVGAGRYSVTLEDRAPGLWQEYRVIAIRHARDPDDPRGRAMRQIRGIASDPMRACAEGALRAPEDFRASVSAAGVVTLRWTNRDRYTVIELRRWVANDWQVKRVPLSGDAESFVDPEPLPVDTIWRIELTSAGHDARVRCGPIEARRFRA